MNGIQRPRFECIPPVSNGTAGQEAVELAALAGLELDPWQQYVLENSLGKRINGKWSARDVGLIVSRQNGKGSVLEARELAGLFLLDEMELIHTAHQFKTSDDHFLRIRTLIKGTPDFMALVKHNGIREGNTNPSITLKSDARLRFVARSVNGSGRGFSKIDLLVLDEAFKFPRAAQASMLPIQLAASDPQTWYVSSVEDAGDETDALKRVRDRGRAGTSQSLAYFEWSAPDGSDPDDPHARAQANPGLGIRLAHESLQSLRDGMDTYSFQVEHLSMWPRLGRDIPPIFGSGQWEACAVGADSKIATRRCFGVSVSHDRQRATIGVAGAREDNRLHLEPVDMRAGTDWLMPRMLELQAKWQAPFAVSKAGPAASLIDDFRAAGLQIEEADTSDDTDAFGQVFDAVQARVVAHMNDSELNDAVQAAEPRKVGQRTALEGRTTAADITPLDAVMLAGWASLAGRALDYDIDRSFY